MSEEKIVEKNKLSINKIESSNENDEKEKHRLNQIKKTFLDEFSKLDDIEQLKDLYATQLAKRDKIIFELQKENELLLKTAFKNKKYE